MPERITDERAAELAAWAESYIDEANQFTGVKETTAAAAILVCLADRADRNAELYRLRWKIAEARKACQEHYVSSREILAALDSEPPTS